MTGSTPFELTYNYQATLSTALTKQPNNYTNIFLWLRTRIMRKDTRH